MPRNRISPAFCFLELGPVGHGCGTVQQQVGGRPGLFTVFANHRSILPCEHLPIEMTKVIAGGVLFVLHKIGRSAEAFGWMMAGKDFFRDDPCPQLQCTQLEKLLRWLKGCVCFPTVKWTSFYESLTCDNNSPTTVPASTPSDAASKLTTTRCPKTDGATDFTSSAEAAYLPSRAAFAFAAKIKD